MIVNTLDPLSVQIGEYHAGKQRIGFQNIIKVAFPPGTTTLTSKEFGAIKASVDQQSGPRVQAYALTWAAPYRVECMSITSAFAFGFDRAFCDEGCKPTRPSPYFNSRARLPFTKLRMRPAMAIAATSIEQARALIDRGLESDGSQPAGTAYLISTSDSLRNVRSASYPLFERLFKSRIRVSTLRQDALTNANDVLFYFAGKAHVKGLDTLHFVPSAIADHLTSADSGQMSALRWLEAGATGSYGTVSEPCNLTQKFPNPVVVSGFYLRTIQGPLRLEGKRFWSNGSHPVFSRHGTCCLPAPAATRAAAAHDRRGSRKTASNCS